MSGSRPRLAFVSPVFLFPADTGGRIRTTNILRGLHEGAFEVTLVGPATAGQRLDWAQQLRDVCDHFVPWQPGRTKPRWIRAFDLLRALPVNVAADHTTAGRDAVKRVLDGRAFDVVVFDFVHAAVLRPERIGAATVCFTHNVEAEIFARHAERARSTLERHVWRSQHAKMQRFEREALRAFQSVVAVSARDAQHFKDSYGVCNVATIPTGVDLDYFSWTDPLPIDASHPPTVVFTGSMDWEANIDGVRYFIDEVWPLVLGQLPQARFVVVGRNPPKWLTDLASRHPAITFTGLVDDVRPHVRSAHVSVIPLRVGGGTRIKAFESMALGRPVVSTSIGIEGLDVHNDEHFLQRDDARGLAQALVTVLNDAALRHQLARRARACVEDQFGHRVAARVFERACLDAMGQRPVS